MVLPLEGVNQDKDNVFAALDRISVAERSKAPNKPPYKPELAAKVKDLEVRQSQEDPAFYCKPAGVPRMGPPAQIIQMQDKVVFLYATNLFRLIPIQPFQSLGDSCGTRDLDGSAIFELYVNLTHFLPNFALFKSFCGLAVPEAIPTQLR